MEVKQFEYKPLSHYSYAIVSEKRMVIIDPERNPLLYYEYADECEAKIVAVILTHPHADFVSSHLQIHEETGAPIYNSAKVGANYPHKSFDEGDSLSVGTVYLSVLNTPGHSPDSITIIAKEAKEIALFTGDTLFVGDVGRPDLREKSGNTTAKRKELAAMMYDTIKNKFTHLPNEAVVYPTHGSGSLCGKNMSDASKSTLGDERKSNWAFEDQTEEEFIQVLIDSQPFIPSYFGFNVDINKVGAPQVRKALGNINFRLGSSANGLIIDVRDKKSFKTGHIAGSINIQATSENDKFETWLGSIVQPKESFSLVIASSRDLDTVLNRVSKIGYENQLETVFTLRAENLEKSDQLNIEDFRKNRSNYTIVDIRNQSEINDQKYFDSALEHPLNELRDTYKDIPTDKPIVVHCAGGYRSAAGSSILKRQLDNVKIFDLSEHIKELY